MKKICVGCGIELQSEDSKRNGYLPKSVLESKRDEYRCQRCFKISNYGEYIPIEMSREDYKEEVSKNLDKVDIVLPVFDIIDFEGSFDDEILDILREKDSIVIINKIDLIPDEKHPSEVADWVKMRLGEEGIAPLDIAIVSSKQNYGTSGIYKKLRYFLQKGGKAMILGVTNVGKSSIINRIFGGKKVTVSKFPGTTLKSIEMKIPDTDITLIDTPGLIPTGRFSDLVCEECNQKIIPSNEISRKTYKVSQNRVILLGGMVKMVVLNGDELKPIFSLYASKDVKFHETNLEKADNILENLELIYPPCKNCKSDFEKNKKIKRVYTVESGDELVFKGLGWISVKRGPLKLEIESPEYCDIVIREGFIKPKR